jgi:hypothetical protein
MNEIYEIRVKDTEECYKKIYVATNDILQYIKDKEYDLISMKKMDRSDVKIYD